MATENVEVKKRANSAYTYAVIDGCQVFDFGPAVGRIVFDPARVSAENRSRAMTHGFKQRIVDAGAISADEATGRVDVGAKFAEMKRIADHLMSGSPDWNIRVAADGGAGPGRASMVTRALVRIGTFQGRDVSTPDLANAFVRALAESKNPALAKYGFGGQVGKVRAWLEKSSRTVSEMIDRIRAEEAAGQVDVDAALGELGEL